MLPVSPLSATLPAPAEEVPRGAGVEARCILTLGAALLGYGLPAHRVAEAIHRLSTVLGLRSSVFALPTYLAVTFQGSRGHELHSAHVQPSTIDLTRLDALHHLVSEIERGTLSAPQAEREMGRIIEAPRPLARYVEALAVVLVASGGSLALGGEVGDALCGALLGMLVGALLWAGCVWPAIARITPVIAAVCTTVVSAELTRAAWMSHPLLVVFASLFVFVPGLSLTLAMTELATGHLVSGTARLVGAITVFLQLALGMLLGARMSALVALGASVTIPASSWPVAALGSLVLSLGFAILFAVRVTDALCTFGISALAFIVGRGVGELLGPEIGALLSATLVGVASHAFARRWDRPSSVLSLPGMAMLVPGSLGMLSISAAVLHNPARALELGFQMLMVLVSLSTGVLLSAAALPPRTSL